MEILQNPFCFWQVVEIWVGNFSNCTWLRQYSVKKHYFSRTFFLGGKGYGLQWILNHHQLQWKRLAVLMSTSWLQPFEWTQLQMVPVFFRKTSYNYVPYRIPLCLSNVMNFIWDSVIIPTYGSKRANKKQSDVPSLRIFGQFFVPPVGTNKKLIGIH